MIDAPAPFNRAMSWVNYLLDVRGELYWRVNAADRANTSWSNQWLAGGNGDGSLTYPGTPAQIGGTTFVPVASVRMKLIRDGLEDLEYMYLAEAKVGRAKVLEVVRSVVRAAYDFEHSAEPWLAAREAGGADRGPPPRSPSTSSTSAPRLAAASPAPPRSRRRRRRERCRRRRGARPAGLLLTGASRSPRT